MRDRVIPGVDDRDYRARAQRQFDGIVEKYPQRTFGHPPVAEIFPPSYAVVAKC
jgi:hypothetical protein